jgi:hypothetical protein
MTGIQALERIAPGLPMLPGKHEAAWAWHDLFRTDLKFLRSVAPGYTITVTVRVKEKRAVKHIVILETSCSNQKWERSAISASGGRGHCCPPLAIPALVV